MPPVQALVQAAQRRGIRPRYGVLGEPASLCVVERFIRSMKDECTRRLVLVPMSHAAFRKELSAYASWYNRWRPHATLGGRTPEEAFENRAAPQRRFETRPLWPRHGAVRRDALRLELSYVAGRKHLPVIELRRAASAAACAEREREREGTRAFTRAWSGVERELHVASRGAEGADARFIDATGGADNADKMGE